MKKQYLLAVLSMLLFIGHTSAEAIILDGSYQFRNVFVLNSEDPTGVGYCVKEVKVNGNVTTDEINSSAFEIDLSQYGLSSGDRVEIKIVFADGCSPKVLNPDALKAKPTFDVKEIEVDRDGVLKWVSWNEQGPIPYYVQQFKWNKWVTLGVIEGIGTRERNEYRFKVVPVYGKNKVRVIQKGINGDIRTTKVVSFDSDTEKITFNYDKKMDLVTFSGDTSYELYDGYGQLVERGYGSSISTTKLYGGDYYVTYDSSTGSFIKR